MMSCVYNYLAACETLRPVRTSGASCVRLLGWARRTWRLLGLSFTVLAVVGGQGGGKVWQTSRRKKKGKKKKEKEKKRKEKNVCGPVLSPSPNPRAHWLHPSITELCRPFSPVLLDGRAAIKLLLVVVAVRDGRRETKCWRTPTVDDANTAESVACEIALLIWK
ncbi:hypothetical protein D8B26_002773 [Coccidioides posadasii str. Silveira]|uniref:Uncharacterized protein n=1 Tax=Coccidioides posadasii (strain RMSCC 757 / Silveira) TaxID=443226 RepID=E9CYB4_COCPS|nr:hypothetical protein CPSG_02784 [Coccidioides posadasii str. Silveira]QVM08075.1 hypothetical protein D8B26_002773 [Coccidioides posadasii str. Silveira]